MDTLCPSSARLRRPVRWQKNNTLCAELLCCFDDCDHRDVDCRGSALTKSSRAFVGGCACSRNVIHKQDRLTFDFGSLRDSECAIEILQTLRSWQTRLIFRVESFLQRVLAESQFHTRRDGFAHGIGLMMRPSKSVSPVLRHGHDAVQLERLQFSAFLIAQVIGKSSTQRFGARRFASYASVAQLVLVNAQTNQSLEAIMASLTIHAAVFVLSIRSDRISTSITG